MLKLHLLFPVNYYPVCITLCIWISFCKICEFSVTSRASVLTHFEGAYANFIVHGRHDGTATPTNAGTSDVAMRLWRASRRRRCRASLDDRPCFDPRPCALIAGFLFSFRSATCWYKMLNYKHLQKAVIAARASCAMRINI